MQYTVSYIFGRFAFENNATMFVNNLIRICLPKECRHSSDCESSCLRLGVSSQSELIPVLKSCHSLLLLLFG